MSVLRTLMKLEIRPDYSVLTLNFELNFWLADGRYCRTPCSGATPSRGILDLRMQVRGSRRKRTEDEKVSAVVVGQIKPK